MITLTQLSYLVAVERFGNFRQAAKKCFVTQPTLSMQIKKLEDDLGIVIFDRSHQPITATPIGAKILAQSRIVLGETAVIEAMIGDARGDITGEVRLAVIPTLSPYLLPLFLTQFQEYYPKVQLRIEEQRTEDIMAALKQNQLDIGLMATPLSDSDLIEHRLFNEPFYVYAAASSALANHKEIHQQDLVHESLLLLAEGHCLREQSLRVCRQPRTKSNKRGELQFASGSLGTLCRLVERGHGYTVLPDLARPWEARAAGRVIPFAEPVPTREVSLVVHRAFIRRHLLDAMQQTIIAALPRALRQKSSLQRTVPL